MSNTEALRARLLAHAAIHDAETSPYSPEQAQWAADLREAARNAAAQARRQRPLEPARLAGAARWPRG